MKYILFSLLLVAPIQAQDKPVDTKTELTEITNLKIQLFEAKTRILQLENQLQQIQINGLNEQLKSEQDKLISQARIELKAKPDDVWDWESHSFKPKEVKPEEKK